MKTCWQMEIDSPLGALTLQSDGEALTRVRLPDEMATGATGLAPRPDLPVFVAAAVQFREYFAGERTGFDLPLAPGGTPFQVRVWQELRRIPVGTTITYAELAQRVESPQGFRAVGAANGRNPLPIIVPCHRVIGSNGRLTGFAGGLAAKQWLLQHEGAR
jgi:methylated-DNA-[protein]-cysteine S-methyltransferase